MCSIFSWTILPTTILVFLHACKTGTKYQPMNVHKMKANYYDKKQDVFSLSDFTFHTTSHLNTDTISTELFAFLFVHPGSWIHGFHERSLEPHHCSKNFKQHLLNKWAHTIRLKDSKSPGHCLNGAHASLVWFCF